MLRSSARRLPVLLAALAMLLLLVASPAGVRQAQGASHGPAPLPWRPGAVVPAFGSGGTVRLRPPGEPTAWEHLAVDAAGRVLLLAETKEGGSFLTRLRPDGTPDPEFAGGGWLATPAGAWEEIALDPEGRILLAGSVERDLAVARLTPEGAPDPSFGTDGVARLHADLPGVEPRIEERLTRLVPTADGGVLAAGSVGFCYVEICAEASGVVVKLTAAGAPDPSFGDGGIDLPALTARPDPRRGRGVLREAYALAVQPDGKILVGGTDSRLVVVVRLTAAGATDTSFGEKGTFATNRETEGEDEFHGGGEGLFYPGSARDLLVEPSGRIVVVGIRLMYGLRPDGRIDPRFGYPESGANFRGVTTIAPQSVQNSATDALLDGAGRIVVVGKVNGGPGVARFLPDGRADARFGGGGMMPVRLGNAFPPPESITPTLTSVGRLPGGDLVMAGSGYFDRRHPHLEAIVMSRNDRSGRFAYCGGSRAVYQGTPRSDRLGWYFGTIVTFGGNDKIAGAGGAVCTGSGDDVVLNRINYGEPIYLGAGDDRSIGSTGRIFGGPGDDVLIAGEEGEGSVLRGGPGDDVLIGGPDDVLIGGPGHDRIIRRPG